MGAGFKVGGKGGGASELALKMILELTDQGFDFKGEWEFKGLILFFMSYSTASIKKGQTSKHVDSGLGGDDFEDEVDGDIQVSEAREVWTIFQPFKKPFWER